MDLARSLAARYAKGRRPLDQDLAQEAAIGLVIASRRWDPSFGVRFATYATHWARRAILLHLRDVRRLVRVPRSDAGILAAGAMAAHDVADAADLAGRAQIPLSAAEALYPLLASTETGIQRIGLDGDEYEWIASSSDTERDASDAEQRRQIRAVVERGGNLSQAERDVIALRFFDPDEPSQRVVGESINRGVSKQRVDSIEYVALRKLAPALRRFA